MTGKLINYLAGLLSEPSTWAGLGAVSEAAGLPHGVAGGFGLVAIFLREKSASK